MTNVTDLTAYRLTRQREAAIDEAITGLIAARAEKIIDEYRNVLNSDDPLYHFFMGDSHG